MLLAVSADPAPTLPFGLAVAGAFAGNRRSSAGAGSLTLDTPFGAATVSGTMTGGGVTDNGRPVVSAYKQNFGSGVVSSATAVSGGRRGGNAAQVVTYGRGGGSGGQAASLGGGKSGQQTWRLGPNGRIIDEVPKPMAQSGPGNPCESTCKAKCVDKKCKDQCKGKCTPKSQGQSKGKPVQAAPADQTLFLGGLVQSVIGSLG
jgi:hypothetical protein